MTSRISAASLVRLLGTAAVLGFAALAVSLTSGRCVAADGGEVATAPTWDKETIDLFRKLPIQDEGRIKPLDTYAGFKLLKLNGRRSCSTPDGRRLTPVEWLLDVILFPDIAQDYAVFSVDTSEVIVSLGLMPHEKKRDRYSYRELNYGRAKLMELAGLYAHVSAKERTAVQNQIVNLAQNLMEYEALAEYAGFARKPFTLPPCEAWSRIFPQKSEVGLTGILKKAPTLQDEFMALSRNKGEMDEAHKQDLEAIRKLMGDLDEVRTMSTALALFPPTEREQEAWITPADIVLKAFDPNVKIETELALLGNFENMVRATGAPDQFKSHAGSFCRSVIELAEQRGEYGKIPLEVAFYKGKFFSRSLVFYIVAFLLVAMSWLAPKVRWLNGAALVGVLIPTLFLIAGITLRCIIRGRPPVTTLYETILFTTAVAVVVCMFIETINRQGIAVSMGAILGVLGVFLANKYEAGEGVDTMPSMVAVLDTNFWLATHVTTISMGYAAGLLSGAIAHIYIFARLFGLKKSQPDFYEGLCRMVYGVFCFGFFFSFIGTLLGGVWADQSWGRFWGWDPKENGALLICLWQLAALHARRGAYIRELGFNAAAVICGMVVAFSWWGVNLLGVGLHSYGFTSGAMTGLMTFWSIETLVVLAGVFVWAKEHEASAPAKARQRRDPP
jgi:ABC-type transport system involved in cytochrome c biogenesis permease subunit